MKTMTLSVCTVVALLNLTACGDQVVVEGVEASDGALVGDTVLDAPMDTAAGLPGADANATGDPYEEAIEGEKNLGPNAPGYIP
ncbi:hypothetical protein CKO36_17190 [Rhabdochromatium marinum]|nr:hypothetical protein [Rhabdochromatium marinum]